MHNCQFPIVTCYHSQMICCLVVFIIYALIAVPVMASLAVSAVQGIVTQLSELRLSRRKVDEGVETEDASDVISHAEYVERFHASYEADKEARRKESKPNTTHPKVVERRGSDQVDDPEDDDLANKKKSEANDELSLLASEESLTTSLIEHALALERHSRRLLMTHLPNGSKAQIVLKADRNVQLRHLQAMLNKEEEALGRERSRERNEKKEKEKEGESEKIKLGLENRPTETDPSAGDNDERPTDKDLSRLRPLHLKGDDDPDWISHPLDDDGTMEEIRRYRESFAAFLAISSRLRKLEGIEMYKAERRLMTNDEKKLERTENEVEGFRREVMEREKSQTSSLRRGGEKDEKKERTAVNDRLEGRPDGDTSKQSKVCLFISSSHNNRSLTCSHNFREIVPLSMNWIRTMRLTILCSYL